MNPGDLIVQAYRLEQKLGEGAAGVVWVATDLRSQQRVAIKLLKSLDDDARRRFKTEASALRRLQHPNIVEVLDYGQTEVGTPYLVMPYVSGQPLAEERGNPMSLERWLDVLTQLAQALVAAQAHGISHRDLKPENILVDDTKGGLRLVVVDFGLAKIEGRRLPDVTKTGEVFGTPHYMSPEQLRGARDAGPASDIYALGIIAYELLEGRHPFRGATLIEIAMQHLTSAVPVIQRSDCPEHLRDLVQRMLSKSAGRRPSARAVERALRGQSTARAATEEPRGALAPLLLFGTILSILLVIGFLASSDEPEPAGVERQPLRSGSGLNIIAAYDAGHVDLGAAAPDIGSSTTCTPLGPGKHARVVGHGLERRSVYLYVPDTDLSGDLVLVMHPRLSSTARFIERTTKLSQSARQRGAVLIGLHAAPNEDPWQSHADVDFAAAAVEVARGALCLDDARLYAYGHATGGALADRLRCHLDIDAVATTSVAVRADDKDCAQSPTPFLRIAGRNDPLIPLEGGRSCMGPSGILSSDEANARLRRQAASTSKVARWATVEGLECERWEGDAPVVSCVHEQGHHWANEATKERYGVEGVFGCKNNPPITVDLTAAIWQFFDEVGASDSPERRPGRTLDGAE